MDTTKIFANGDLNEFDATFVDLRKKNINQAKEIINIKLEQESKTILLCEVME